MSPYTVTTTAPNDVIPHPDVERMILSRHPVATLDEARRAAAESVFEHIGHEENLGYRRRPLSTPGFVAECHALPEQGGSVSLPDGTVIEVEKVGWVTLAHRAGVDFRSGDQRKPGKRAEIIAAAQEMKA